ncbi:ribonuclease III [Ferrimicrobium acidiphilum]|uniref:ribonuclease III n=1 Tax=Ferrimicrobium acidiphilum TaxID=121039 RepID=UPI0023F1994C|nr:ribonuclease III [Ferrimicrobium acidiphilum]
MASRHDSDPEPGILALLPSGFVDHALFAQAMTHRSGTDEPLASNERLELLGDAVVELVVTDRLFHQFPGATEGRLTKLRAALVSRAVLAERASALGLGQLLIVGQADARSANALSNALEALIGAVYEVHGLDGARWFVEHLLDPLLAELTDDLILGDFKSHLHEVLAHLRRGAPIYDVSWTGPDHARVFQVRLRVEGLPVVEGVGHSRKEAEQAASREALRELAALADELAPEFGVALGDEGHGFADGSGSRPTRA